MTILHQGRVLHVDWQRKKIKNIYLRIRPQGNITVSSPLHTSEAAVVSFVRSKADWIVQKQQERHHPLPGHLFLQGRQFALSEFAPQSEQQVIARQAEQLLPQRFEWICHITGLTPRLQIQKMSGKFGCCTPGQNLIALNPRLVMAPPACIDYVILHEFMHLFVGGHGPDFHRLVQTYLPNERELSKELNRYPI